jgi:hypothetical protein
MKRGKNKGKNSVNAMSAKTSNFVKFKDKLLSTGNSFQRINDCSFLN